MNDGKEEIRDGERNARLFIPFDYLCHITEHDAEDISEYLLDAVAFLAHGTLINGCSER